MQIEKIKKQEISEICMTRNFVLFTKYYLSDEMEGMMGWPCSFTRTKVSSYKVLAGKFERKRPFRRLKEM
jgi:hypothetical protein